MSQFIDPAPAGDFIDPAPAGESSTSAGSFILPAVAEDKRIHVGAFKARLGVDALAIAVSSHPVCVALREMLYDQDKGVALDSPTLSMYLDMLISSDQPEASAYFPGSGPMTAEKKANILNAPILEGEKP